MRIVLASVALAMIEVIGIEVYAPHASVRFAVLVTRIPRRAGEVRVSHSERGAVNTSALEPPGHSPVAPEYLVDQPKVDCRAAEIPDEDTVCAHHERTATVGRVGASGRVGAWGASGAGTRPSFPSSEWGSRAR